MAAGPAPDAHLRMAASNPSLCSAGAVSLSRLVAVTPREKAPVPVAGTSFQPSV